MMEQSYATSCAIAQRALTRITVQNNTQHNGQLCTDIDSNTIANIQQNTSATDQHKHQEATARCDIGELYIAQVHTSSDEQYLTSLYTSQRTTNIIIVSHASECDAVFDVTPLYTHREGAIRSLWPCSQPTLCIQRVSQS